MRSPPRSPLFHAIVLTGVSLAAACGKEAVSQPDDAGAAAATDGSTTPEGATDSSVTDANIPDGSCPDGSELPVPPCYLIK